MLAKKYRLPCRVRFANSSSFSTLFFIAKVKPNTLLLNRFGVIISKRIDKRAVVRNRIRRLIYTVIGELQDTMKQGIDTLFIVKKDAIGKTKKDFYLSIKQMFLKERLLK